MQHFCKVDRNMSIFGRREYGVHGAGETCVLIFTNCFAKNSTDFRMIGLLLQFLLHRLICSFE